MNTGKRLMRSMSDRWLAGVCSGIANYFGWDVAILRLVYLLLTLCTAFSGIIIYIILWICMPEDNN
ncbi:PspC domain-containing protein [Hallella mizrahii]|uniref:PspC domain-containing protein n=1 Tax=Hallella mizrahii TaxID=2606637 RepID=A0A7K0KJ71_9BACT|nr:PspC domain-containing protein [Hallella mizrahii]MST85976.1 PspC domain-containing protein [Hallella mizrahii]